MARLTNAKFVKPAEQHVLSLEVVRSERVSSSFQRVTIGGEALGGFSAMGFDQWFRMFVPNPGQRDMRLPTVGSSLWYAQWLATPAARRPHCRNYTVREFRPESGELDIDFVIHLAPGTEHAPDAQPDGVAAAWSLAASSGDEIAILDQGITYAPSAGQRETFIIADESALPAAEGILASLPSGVRGTAVLEVPNADDRRDLPTAADIDVHWVVRSDSRAPHGTPGIAALEHTRGLPIPDAASYVFAVGESALATGARRHFIAAHLPKENVRFCGCWKSASAAAKRRAA